MKKWHITRHVLSYGRQISSILLSQWVSEWLLFNTDSAIFQLYHGENKLISNQMMMRSTLY
jgi:hypothetical protein